MVASAIAYFAAAFFMCLFLCGVYSLGTDKPQTVGKEGAYIWISLLFLGASYLAARLGGI